MALWAKQRQFSGLSVVSPFKYRFGGDATESILLSYRERDDISSKFQLPRLHIHPSPPVWGWGSSLPAYEEILPYQRKLQPATPISTLDGNGSALQLRMATALRQMTTNHSFGVHGVYSDGVCHLWFCWYVMINTLDIRPATDTHATSTASSQQIRLSHESSPQTPFAWPRKENPDKLAKRSPQNDVYTHPVHSRVSAPGRTNPDIKKSHPFF